MNTVSTVVLMNTVSTVVMMNTVSTVVLMNTVSTVVLMNTCMYRDRAASFRVGGGAIFGSVIFVKLFFV